MSRPKGKEPKGSEEFDCFEALTKGLLTVPKDELDKARKKDEEKRAKENGKRSR